MHDDTGVKFSVNFGHRIIYQEISCIFVGTGIGMPMYPGNNFFVKFSCLKFGHTKNSWEIWINNTKNTMASSGSHPHI